MVNKGGEVWRIGGKFKRGFQFCSSTKQEDEEEEEEENVQAISILLIKLLISFKWERKGK